MTPELKQEIESARELARTGDYNEHPCEIGYAETIVDLADRIEQLEAALRPFIDAIGRIDLSREDGENRVEIHWGKARATAVTVASFTQALAALETKHD